MSPCFRENSASFIHREQLGQHRLVEGYGPLSGDPDELRRESPRQWHLGKPNGECAVDREELQMQEYHGGCHCGALGIIYRTDIDPIYWRLRHDGCSFCRRHGVVGTSDPAGNLSVNIGDPSKVRYYRFAHRTADFLICGECGVFVAAVSDTGEGKRAVINARVLDGVSLMWAAVADAHFDDESPQQRAERRRLHWTPVLNDGRP
jgi:hypothetical protein